MLLRNQAGKEIRVPQHLLSEKDLGFVKQGRHWATYQNRQLVLVQDNEKTRKLTFLDPIKSGPFEVPGPLGNAG